MWLKNKLVILPTKEKSKITLIDNKNLYYGADVKLEPHVTCCVNQHIYILSDEKPKQDDWCICLSEVESNKLPENKDVQINPLVKWSDKNNCLGCKKIIATTDTSLTIETLTTKKLSIGLEEKQLPTPTQQFILFYINEYNDNNKIEEVMVEYYKYIDGDTDDYCVEFTIPNVWIEKLLVNKNNTINIL